MSIKANDMQVAGRHYRSTYQHWDFVYDVLGGRYLEGNITKYLSRHAKKNGAEDLAKATHYIDKLLELYDAGKVLPLRSRATREHEELARLFCRANALDTATESALRMVCMWDRPLLVRAREEIRRMERRLRGQDEDEDSGEPGPGYVAQG